MPSYTYTAFRWGGTGYNNTYNTSYTAVINDDDPNYQGSADGNETASINGGAFGATSGQPYVIRVPFTDPAGNPHVEDFYFFHTGGNWYFIPGPGSDFTVGSTLGMYQSHTNGWNYDDVACFLKGTRIRTAQGPVAVEDLRAGMNIISYDGGIRTLRLVLSRRIQTEEYEQNPRLRPVRIMAGALGAGLPKRDLLVSRQHRMLVSSKIARRMFGQPEVLVAAIKLCALPGVFIDEEIQSIEYFHLVFDAHEVIYAEDAPSESLFTGAEAMKSLTDSARKEMFAIFPDLESPMHLARAARMIPDGRQQKQLIMRHVKNDHTLLGYSLES